ncbi:hypothetical protein B6V88_03485 [Legionella micdadei]|nr:hypothetical protein B6V88_03485 [Legionella micdadei]
MLRNPYTHFKLTSESKSSATDLLSSSSPTEGEPSGVPIAVGIDTLHSLQRLNSQTDKMMAISKTPGNMTASATLGKALKRTGSAINNEFPKEIQEVQMAQAESSHDSSPKKLHL